MPSDDPIIVVGTYNPIITVVGTYAPTITVVGEFNND